MPDEPKVPAVTPSTPRPPPASNPGRPAGGLEPGAAPRGTGPGLGPRQDLRQGPQGSQGAHRRFDQPGLRGRPDADVPAAAEARGYQSVQSLGPGREPSPADRSEER